MIISALLCSAALLRCRGTMAGAAAAGCVSMVALPTVVRVRAEVWLLGGQGLGPKREPARNET